MPVTLDALTDPDERDRAELARLADEQEGDGGCRAAWRDWLADDDAVRLWAGRFNERIVGAILTRGRCIEGFAVRRITRGRGVGTRMLQCLGTAGDWCVSRQLAPAVRDFIHLEHGVPLCEPRR